MAERPGPETTKTMTIGWHEIGTYEMKNRRSTPLAACLALGLLIAPLAACAPEPGSSDPGNSKPGTQTPGEKEEPEGGSWPEKNPDEVFEKHTELPADFPSSFTIPEGAKIDDAGTRGVGVWYLVLRAGSTADADALWAGIVESNGFAVSDEFTTAEKGRAATLRGAVLSVTALTIPQSDGTVLISYDITRLVS